LGEAGGRQQIAEGPLRARHNGFLSVRSITATVLSGSQGITRLEAN
jgi:hypothetical protein